MKDKGIFFQSALSTLETSRKIQNVVYPRHMSGINYLQCTFIICFHLQAKGRYEWKGHRVLSYPPILLTFVFILE